MAVPELRMRLEEAASRGLVHPTRYNEGDPVDYGVIPSTLLEHVETFTRPEHLARLRDNWDPAQVTPIRLAEGDSGWYVLLNGNHRLRLARERGDRTIAADIALPRRNRR